MSALLDSKQLSPSQSAQAYEDQVIIIIDDTSGTAITLDGAAVANLYSLLRRQMRLMVSKEMPDE